MKIAYTKRYLRVNLIIGIVCLIFGLLNLDFNGENRWNDYIYLVFGILYLIFYTYQKKFQYLIIEDGILKINSFFGKQISLNDIKQIKKYAGDYILKSDTKKLTINTLVIDPNSLAELNVELEKRNIAWQ